MYGSSPHRCPLPDLLRLTELPSSVPFHFSWRICRVEYEALCLKSCRKGEDLTNEPLPIKNVFSLEWNIFQFMSLSSYSMCDLLPWTPQPYYWDKSPPFSCFVIACVCERGVYCLEFGEIKDSGMKSSLELSKSKLLLLLLKCQPTIACLFSFPSQFVHRGMFLLSHLVIAPKEGLIRDCICMGVCSYTHTDTFR